MLHIQQNKMETLQEIKNLNDQLCSKYVFFIIKSNLLNIFN